MPVPEGLAGMRVDAGLARLLGMSRTAAAAVAEDGGVEIDGVLAGKSDRLTGGAWLSVTLPESPAPVENTPVEIEGMTILYSDDDIVAVDKPPGVAAHATVGWHGPTVLGGLAAAGFRISTSGVHERQGIVQRLDVGTSGVMVVARSEHAYTVLKRAFKQRTVDKRYHAVVQGHPDPSSGTIDAPIGRHPGGIHRPHRACPEHGRSGRRAASRNRAGTAYPPGAARPSPRRSTGRRCDEPRFTARGHGRVRWQPAAGDGDAACLCRWRGGERPDVYWGGTGRG